MHNIQYPPQLATLNTMFIDGGPGTQDSHLKVNIKKGEKAVTTVF